MRYQDDLKNRDAGYTICREAAFTLSDVESAATRLKSWAVIMGVGVAGPAFVRLTSDMTAHIHLPVDRAVDTSAEDGITSGRISAGAGMSRDAVAFDEMRDEARALRAEIGAGRESAGPVEFHSGPDGMRVGSLFAPVMERHILADVRSAA